MVDRQPTAIITGANRGIGLEVVKNLTTNGYRIAACVRSVSVQLEEIVEKNDHKIFCMDMNDENSIKNRSREILKWADYPDVLVNCAGTAIGNLFAMTSMNDLRELYQVNLFGPLLFTQYVAKKMLLKKQGSIVNIASTAGLLADRGTLAYGGTKASLIHATRVIASELGTFGIRVNAIAPSVVDTEMAKQMDQQSRDKLDERSFLKGKIEGSDVAELVRFLISPNSKKITGQIIRVDRGMPF